METNKQSITTSIAPDGREETQESQRKSSVQTQIELVSLLLAFPFRLAIALHFSPGRTSITYLPRLGGCRHRNVALYLGKVP